MTLNVVVNILIFLDTYLSLLSHSCPLFSGEFKKNSSVGTLAVPPGEYCISMHQWIGVNDIDYDNGATESFFLLRYN